MTEFEASHRHEHDFCKFKQAHSEIEGDGRSVFHQLPNSNGLDFQGFEIRIPMMLGDIKQKLLDILGLSTEPAFDGRIASLLTMSAASALFADG